MVLLLLHFMLMLQHLLLLALLFALLAALVSHHEPPFCNAYIACKQYTIFLLSIGAEDRLEMGLCREKGRCKCVFDIAHMIENILVVG